MNTTRLMCESCFAPLDLENSRHGIVICEYCSTQHNLGSEVKLKIKQNDREVMVKTIKFLKNNFNLIELAELTTDISGHEKIVNYNLVWDDIPHRFLSEATRNLTEYFYRRGYLNILIEYIVKTRPHFYTELL